jgi:hypothetical protein
MPLARVRDEDGDADGRGELDVVDLRDLDDVGALTGERLDRGVGCRANGVPRRGR